ncbi:MAG: IclR family transcriptional regulator [Pseudomonadales bacterium]
MSEGVQGAKSFSRTIAVLQLVADAPQPIAVADLLVRSALTRPTLYRILAALEAEHLVVQNSDKRYQMGSRVVSLAHRALAQMDIRTLAREPLEALRDTLGETVHLAIRSSDELVYVDKIESREVVRMASTVGTRVPFHSSSVGKAYLGAMSADEACELIDRLEMVAITEHSSTDKTAFKAYIESVRQCGYAFESEENEQGIVCFGAAILDAQHRPAASVSVSVPMFRLKEDRQFYVAALRSACAAISRQLGWTGKNTGA